MPHTTIAPTAGIPSHRCALALLLLMTLAASPVHAAALARGKAVRMALNQVMSDESAMLADGSEVAFFPPVTGG